MHRTIISFFVTVIFLGFVAASPALAGNVRIIDTDGLATGTDVCTSAGSPRLLSRAPDLAQGKAFTEGVFDCAEWTGNYWAAQVRTPNGLVKRDLRECGIVRYNGHRDLYCVYEVQARTSVDTEPDREHHDNNADARICSTKTPSDADAAGKPDGWGGLYKCAASNGDAWVATRYDGVEEDGFSTCMLHDGKFVICQ